jgi:hypothetical protein
LPLSSWNVASSYDSDVHATSGDVGETARLWAGHFYDGGRLSSACVSHDTLPFANGALDADTAAQVIASSMVGLVMRRQILHDPGVLNYTHGEIAQAIVETFLQGAQAR